MGSLDKPSRTRTIFWTLAVIGALAALTWYRAQLGRAQWGPADATDPARDTAIEPNAPGG